MMPKNRYVSLPLIRWVLAVLLYVVPPREATATKDAQEKLLGMKRILLPPLACFCLGAMMVEGLVPLLLHKSGFPMWKLLLLMAAVYVVSIFSVRPIATLVERIGPPRAHALSYLTLAVSFGALQLYLITEQMVFLWSFVGLQALTSDLLGYASSLYDSLFLSKDKVGRQLAILNMTGAICFAAAPGLGLLLMWVAGDSALIWGGIALLLLGAAFALRMPPVVVPPSNSVGQRTPHEIPWWYLASEAEVVIGFLVWPMYITVISSSASSIVAVSTATYLTGLILTWIGGKKNDQKDFRLFKWAARSAALNHMVRCIPLPTLGMSLLMMWSRLSKSAYIVVVGAKRVTVVKAGGPEYLIWMKQLAAATWCAMLLLCCLLIWLLPGVWGFRASFCLAAVAVIVVSRTVVR